jgi:hypothetical protein
MAKLGVHFGAIDPFLRTRADGSGWTLCVGAGTSASMFPNWNELVRRLQARDVGAPRAATLGADLPAAFGPDAWIEAAADRLGISYSHFVSVLADELYSDVKQRLAPDEWDLLCRAFTANQLSRCQRDEWTAFLQLIMAKFPDVSALALARVVDQVIGSALQPTSILSFNAEPLLPALIHAYANERLAKPSNPYPREGEQPRILDLVTHSTSTRSAARIPYYFCHGLLPIPHPDLSARLTSSVDKLVFAESSYLQLANAAFSWQASTFLDLASSTSLLFIGLSLSDPNVRRWLSWTHSNRTHELGLLYDAKKPSTHHYWMRRSSGDPDVERWIESAVAHLGVRMIWLESWEQIEAATKACLGLHS